VHVLGRPEGRNAGLRQTDFRASGQQRQGGAGRSSEMGGLSYFDPNRHSVQE
jgi:hypothetical protein